MELRRKDGPQSSQCQFNEGASISKRHSVLPTPASSGRFSQIVRSSIGHQAKEYMEIHGFGYKTAWFAVRSESLRDVADAIGVSDARDVHWNEGVVTAYSEDSLVFVCPPVEGWILAVGTSLLNLADQEPAFAAVASLVSERLGGAEVHYFASHRVVEAHGWARCKGGQVQRAFLYVGSSGETPVDFGGQSDEERALSFRFFDEQSEEAADDDYWERTDLDFPTETHVMRLAQAWSIDPSSLGERGINFPNGLMGRVDVRRLRSLVQKSGFEEPDTHHSSAAVENSAPPNRRPWWRFW